MQDTQGSFIWYELVARADETAAAAAFYGAVVGWTVEPSEQNYHILKADGVDIGGLAGVPEDAPMKPGWHGYLAVDDIDAAVTAIADDGGRVLMPRYDAPGVGSMALVTDPQGVTFYVIQSAAEGASEAFDPTRNGHGAWNELATTDAAAALAFYGRQFGWQAMGSMPMGDMGDYHMVGRGGAMLGGVMTAAAQGPGPGWRFYFRVDEIDAALDRVVAAGGTVVHGPQEVPGGGFILIGVDPHGTMFALTGPRENDTE